MNTHDHLRSIILIKILHSTSDVNYASLQWYAIQPLFEQADSDVLLILDCCAAASGAPTEGHRSSVTETIAACGFETWAPQPGRHSFTNTLIAVLDDWRDRPAFTAAMLHCEILSRLRHEKPEKYRKTSKFEFRKSPIHIVSTSDPKARSVELCPRLMPGATGDESSPQSGEIRGRGAVLSAMESRVSGGSLDATRSSFIASFIATPATPAKGDDSYSMASIVRALDNGNTLLPHVLISLALEEEQQLDFEQWRRWLQDFPALAKLAKVQGIYKSNSTLLILSVPVVVWDWIPNDPACSFIGYVHSQNLLEIPSVKKKDTVISALSQADYQQGTLSVHQFPALPLPVSTPRSPPCSSSSEITTEGASTRWYSRLLLGRYVFIPYAPTMFYLLLSIFVGYVRDTLRKKVP